MARRVACPRRALLTVRGTQTLNADGATHEDLREAVTTLEETERIARRVLGGAHPLVVRIEFVLRQSRAALRARETPSSGEA